MEIIEENEPTMITVTADAAVRHVQAAKRSILCKSIIKYIYCTHHSDLLSISTMFFCYITLDKGLIYGIIGWFFFCVEIRIVVVLDTKNIGTFLHHTAILKLKKWWCINLIMLLLKKKIRGFSWNLSAKSWAFDTWLCSEESPKRASIMQVWLWCRLLLPICCIQSYCLFFCQGAESVFLPTFTLTSVVLVVLKFKFNKVTLSLVRLDFLWFMFAV